jgi:hypothetical protein
MENVEDRLGVGPLSVGQRRHRSRIGNGALLPGIDQRNTWVRRAKELIADFISDAGGIENTSAAEQAIIRRAAVLIVELERLELKFAKAPQANPVELDMYARCASQMRRLLESIGIRRRARDIDLLDDPLTYAPPFEDSTGG